MGDLTMASSTKQPGRRRKIAQMPSQNGGVAVAEPPEQPQTPFESPQQASEASTHDPTTAAPAQSAPPKRSKGDFFDIVRRVAKEDWGTRIFLYLYCFEPVTDEKQSGEKKYLNRYAQPITDEHAVMIDYGSGKYRLVLTNRKPDGSTEKGAPIESYDFEIYNPKYPPKIPKAAWKNDLRNARWEALLPKEEPKSPPAAVNPLEAFDTFMNIQDRIEDRIKPPAPPPPAAPPPPPDPFDTAKKIMEMRSNDPMIGLFMARLEAADKAAEMARDREFKLLLELRQSATPPPPPPAPTKGLVDQIVELAGVAEKLGPLKALFGGTNGTPSTPAADAEHVRTVRMNGLEFWSAVLPKVFDSPIANAIASKVMASTQQPAQVINTNGAARPVPQQPPANDPFQRFISDVATPAMLEYFLAEAKGEALADWIYSVFPRECVRLQQFTHPMIPGLVGAPAIIQAYKNTPQVWPKLAAKEAAFTVFINEFCAWKPDEDEAVDVEAAPVADEDGWTNGSASETEESTV
jgi:hypothetical protein